MAKKIPIDTQELAVYVLRQVDGMRRDRKHCDFLIKVGSEEIPAHRNILSATSGYFGAMFSHPTEENKSGVVEMKDVDPECAIICVDHMYGKEVSILPEKYGPLMFVANLMLLTKLRDAIAALLEENLDPKSFAATKKIADVYGCKELEEKCKEFAEENFGFISREEEFGELDERFVKTMIKSKNVKISEEEKLDALLRWIKYDSERTELLEALIRIVDLSRISLGFRRNIAEHEPLISENLSLFKMISISVFNSMDTALESIPNIRDGIAIFDKNFGHVYHWKPGNNTWRKMHEMNKDMKSNSFSVVEIAGHLYVLMESKSVYRIKYSDETARWETMSDMLESHGCYPPATVFNGYIYVIGGHHNCSTNSAEKYSPAENTWVAITGKEQASKSTTVIASRQCIHSFGGYVEGKYVKRHERFEPDIQTWAEMLPMKEIKGYTAAATCGGKIFVLGGCIDDGKHLRTVEIFDREKNQWKTLEPMLVARSWFQAFGIAGCIYAVGGWTSSPNSIEKYDIEKNEWKMVEIPSGIKLNISHSAQIKLLT